MYTPLLNRQIKKCLKENQEISPEWHELLNLVNRSYEHYERDHILGKRSLEISSEEMSSLAETLAEKESSLLAMLESASEGVIVVDENDKIELCNTALARLLGFQKVEELVGKQVPQPLTLPEEKMIKEISLDNSERGEIIFEVSHYPVVLPHRKLKMFVLHDITERKKNEKKIAVRHKITHLLLGSTSIEVAAQKILATLCVDLDWGLGILWLKDSLDPTRLKPMYHFQQNHSSNWEAFIQKTLKTSLPAEKNLDVKMGYKRNHLNNDDVSTQEHGMNYAKIPILSGSESFGIIELYRKKRAPFDDTLKKDIGLEFGIFIAKLNEQEKELNLQRQLVDVARQAGMMQVATNILHNVGNLLNTVNVSVSLLKESYAASELQDLTKIANLLKAHENDLASFLTQDPKGTKLALYLIELAKWWEEESKKISQETDLLIEKIQHIKATIKMQQSMGSLMNLKERLRLNQVVDQLLSMFQHEFQKKQIRIQREYDTAIEIEVDRSRLLQILVNLIKNAMEAMEKIEREKTILIKIVNKNAAEIEIHIYDTGPGINPDNFQKIFQFGFTTKKEGHGFGLHTSALLAEEMKGSLRAENRSDSCGATFILTLPK